MKYLRKREKLNEIKEKKIQLENREKTREDLEQLSAMLQEEIAVKQAKLDKFESEYVDYLDKVAEELLKEMKLE